MSNMILFLRLWRTLMFIEKSTWREQSQLQILAPALKVRGLPSASLGDKPPLRKT